MIHNSIEKWAVNQGSQERIKTKSKERILGFQNSKQCMLESRMLKLVEKAFKNNGEVVDQMKYYQLIKVNKKKLPMQVITLKMMEVKKMGVRRLL